MTNVENGVPWTGTGVDPITAAVTRRREETDDAIADNETVLSAFREDFDDATLSRWTTDIGAGMTSGVVGSTLVLNAGTTAGSVTTLISKMGFVLPLRVLFTLQISQRIANQTIVAEIVNAAGDTSASFVFDGTSGTSVKAASQKSNNKATADSAFTTGNTVDARIWEIDARPESVDFYERGADSTAESNGRSAKTRTIPAPAEPYFLRIRIMNGATAPASATTVQLHQAIAETYTRMVVDVGAGRGVTSPARSMGVRVNGGTLALSNANLVIASVAGQQDETTAALAASALYTGTSRDPAGTQTGNRVTRLRCTYRATSASYGTLAHVILEESIDNSTWYETNRMPVPADGALHTWEWTQHFRYYRFKIQNGSFAQTALLLSALQVRTEGASSDVKITMVLPLLNAAQAASASWTPSNVIDLGANHNFDRVRIGVASDQAGNAYLNQSLDGTNFHSTGTSSGSSGYSATDGAVREYLIAGRYLRANIINGATASTRMNAYLALLSL